MLADTPSRTGIQQSQKLKSSGHSHSVFQNLNPLLPLYLRSRTQRARVPEPVEYRGRLYDVMGVSRNGELLLRDQHAVHQDVRLEDFAGRAAILDGVRWRVTSLEVILGPTPLEMEPFLRLVDPNYPLRTKTISQNDMERVRFPSSNGEYKPGRIKHGIMRLISTASRTRRRVPLRPGQRFEARLRHRELHGLYMVEVAADGFLLATGLSDEGQLQQIVIRAVDISPRYQRVPSLDFGAKFDVDMFIFREDQLRNHATNVRANPEGGPIQDPLFGTLPVGDNVLELTSGAEHLAVFKQFILNHIRSPNSSPDAGSRRRLSILNLSMSNQGDARCVLDALIEFRRQNQTAQICVVASKLGPTDFQQSPEFQEYLGILEANRIDLDDYTNTDEQTRQVMHGKAIVIDGHVLFSTGAVMDTRPINKADFSLELPPVAAAAFQRYTDETIHSDAILERRAELAADLAALGVVINDPVAGLTYISRAQNALIRGARHQLIVSLSELVDPTITKLLIHRAASGVKVLIQVRELDPISARLLVKFTKQYPNHLQLEDSSWWEPRPHWNAIIADEKVAYVGSSYLWSTQRNMVHQGRSFENGVLLDGEAVRRLCVLINNLRCQNMVASDFDVSKW